MCQANDETPERDGIHGFYRPKCRSRTFNEIVLWLAVAGTLLFVGAVALVLFFFGLTPSLSASESLEGLRQPLIAYAKEHQWRCPPLPWLDERWDGPGGRLDYVCERGKGVFFLRHVDDAAGSAYFLSLTVESCETGEPLLSTDACRIGEEVEIVSYDMVELLVGDDSGVNIEEVIGAFETLRDDFVHEVKAHNGQVPSPAWLREHWTGPKGSLDYAVDTTDPLCRFLRYTAEAQSCVCVLNLHVEDPEACTPLVHEAAYPTEAELKAISFEGLSIFPNIVPSSADKLPSADVSLESLRGDGLLLYALTHDGQAPSVAWLKERWAGPEGTLDYARGSDDGVTYLRYRPQNGGDTVALALRVDSRSDCEPLRSAKAAVSKCEMTAVSDQTLTLLPPPPPPSPAKAEASLVALRDGLLVHALTHDGQAPSVAWLKERWAGPEGTLDYARGSDDGETYLRYRPQDGGDSVVLALRVDSRSDCEGR